MSTLDKADKLADMGWGRAHELTRGQIVRYFSRLEPDRNGKTGYGFIKRLHDDYRPIKSAKLIWFWVGNGHFLRAAPSGEGLNWTRRYMAPDRKFADPIVGDLVMFEKRPSLRKPGIEAGTWAYESEYIRANEELDEVRAHLPSSIVI